MSRMKTFAKYLIWVILFWILSDILIYFGINSTYKDIKAKNEISSQISVSDAEATTVNGRVIGTVKNSEDNDISNKYLKVDVYAESGNLLGTNFLDIGNMGAVETKNFETYFKIQNVKSYDITIVDEREPEAIGSDNFLIEDLTKFKIITLLAFMLFV